MKCKLSIQERLKDLRLEKGLTLEELGKATGLSKSALGSYESNDYKDISHTAMIILAKFYGVSADYLMGLTENRIAENCELSELNLDDNTIGILKERVKNNRLLCEIIKHPDFWKFMSDTEIYVDRLASMQINNLNSFVAIMRAKILLKNEVPDSEYYIQTLKACEIDENDYFIKCICDDLTKIVEDIRDDHRKDAETGDDNNPLSEVIDFVKEYKTATDPMKATLSTLGKQLGMNFNKMDPAEVQFFTGIVEKYSSVYKKMLHPRGRGKKAAGF